jgi:murein DD-endopeptidase MepM/ murein hydrolase activator NlpD
LLAPENAVWLPSSSDTGGLPAPLKEFVVRPQRVLQGRTVVVEFWSEAPVRATGRLGAWDLRFHEAEEGHWVALQGVHAMATPGLYDLKVDLAISGAHDWGFWHLQPMRVASGGYRYDPVLLVPEETIDPKNTEPENELILDVVSEVTLEKYWSGPFAFPSNYTEAFPSLFGSRRNCNNTGYTAYHTGLDFYGGEGSDVFAPAPGEVVLAAELEVRGNVTFIDHGWGVYTGYLHQSEILVARGEWVETGQVIGKVGSTGRVTGPHLHWEIWVGGVPVDPLEWVATSFP